jgi:hypothetical protein
VTRRVFNNPVSASFGKAFTLLEVILSLSLIVAIMGGVFGYYRSMLAIREEGSQIAKEAMRARATLSKIAEEIRHTANIMPGDGIGFRGKKESITIVHTTLPERYAFEEFEVHEEPPPAQKDIRRITYELLWDDELEDDEGIPICHGLWRSEQKSFDPNPRMMVEEDTGEESLEDDGSDLEEEDGEESVERIEGELIAPEIKYLRFEYFDGAEWLDRWYVSVGQQGGAEGAGLGDDMAGEEGNGEDSEEGGEAVYGLPQAVRVTIGKVPQDPEEELMEQTGKDLDEEKKEALKEYHPDRYTIVVHLRQADESLLRTRLYRSENATDLQMGKGLE